MPQLLRLRSRIWEPQLLKPTPPSGCTPQLEISPGFPGGSEGKASACNMGDLGSIPGLEDPLEKEMATHSNILAWRIPWTEEPGRLQSVGSQRVRHDSDFTFFLYGLACVLSYQALFSSLVQVTLA